MPPWAGVLFGLLCQAFVIFSGTGKWASNIASTENSGPFINLLLHSGASSHDLAESAQ